MILRAMLSTDLTLAGRGGAGSVVRSSGEPYDGPMYVKPDYADEATVIERAGAAGLALECEGEPFVGGGGDYVDGGLESVQESAEEALGNYDENTAMPVSADDFAVERTDGDRVLFSFDVDGETNVAAVAANCVTDDNDDTGWGIEGWAQCDPAELPGSVAAQNGDQVWTDGEGNLVPVTEVTSFEGAEHCDWKETTFLTLGDYDGHAYLGNPTGYLERHLTTTYEPDGSLPDAATDTGYEHDGRSLWLGTEPKAAYLVSTTDPDDVERWPWTTDEIWCA